MRTLEALFFDELADIYDAENRLTKALPALAKAATHDPLRNAIEDHLMQTEGHIKKVEQIFKTFGQPPRTRKCEAMAGLLRESDEIRSENTGAPTINAALISAVQKVEHYEIASYGCLHQWAQQLGNDQASSLLQETLDEEKAADNKLTELARECNPTAQGD